MLNNIPKLGVILLPMGTTKIVLPKDDTVAFTVRLHKDLLDRLDKKRRAVKERKVSRQELLTLILEKVVDDLVIEAPKNK